MKKLTSLLFTLFISGCAFDEPAPIEQPFNPSWIDNSWDHDSDLPTISRDQNDSHTCTPDTFAGCTNQGSAAFCGDDGRSLVIEECAFGCGADACNQCDPWEEGCSPGGKVIVSREFPLAVVDNSLN